MILVPHQFRPAPFIGAHAVKAHLLLNKLLFNKELAPAGRTPVLE